MSVLLAALRSHCSISPRILIPVAAAHCRRLYSDEPGEEEAKTEFFQLSNGDRLAYKKTPGNNLPGIVYLPGFMGNMTGPKARILERYCKLYDYPYIRFDYRSVGESVANDMSKISLEEWTSDVLTVLDTLTNPSDPQVLVGSSLGTFIMLTVALRRPERVFGLVGVATIYDELTRYARAMSEEDKRKLNQEGKIRFPGRDQEVTKYFVETALRMFGDLHGRKTIPVRCPVRLLHGIQDKEVHYDSAKQILSLLESEDVQLILSKSADHRFSKPQDLQMLVNTVDQLVKLYENPYQNPFE